MKTSPTTPMKLGLLTSLYLSQGLPFGFFTQTLPVLLRKQGMSLPDIGLANPLALPWALKFLWAPLMDRYGSERLGRRRGYILPRQCLSAALLLGTLQAGAVLLYALATRGASIPLLTLVCGVEHLTSGMATAALFTVMMEPCRPEHAASDYTVQASLVVLATGAAAAVSGFSAQAFGYAWHFTLSAAVCALAVLWVALTFHPPRTLVSGAQLEVS